MSRVSSKKKLQSMLYVSAGGWATFTGISFYKGEENVYKNYVMPVVHMLDPERAHNLAVWASEHRLIPKSQYKDPDILKVKVFGKEFSNPIGIAAGFDKDGKAVLGLKDIGFGFVEVGSVTPAAQQGNEKPRVFRLNDDLAVINRYGFNSEGHNAVLQRIANVREAKEKIPIIGVNLGKNKTSSDATKDYVEGIQKFGPLSDYLVINISSPNTPNLRDLQHKENLSKLLSALIKARDNLPVSQKPPLLLKLAPDLSPQERRDIAAVLRQKECRVDGLIVCNTTVARPETLKDEKNKNETGGLSGQPLKDLSTEMIRDMSRLTDGIPIIGVGGISSGKDAYEKIKAGASLLQLYTSLAYDGPPVVTRVKKELAQLLVKDGYTNISQAIGVAK